MYCTPADVRLILEGAVSEADEEATWEGTAGALTDTAIEDAIQRATDQIDATLAKIYAVPFDPVPPLIQGLCADIAAYLADLNYRKSREYESQNYPVIFRYNRAREMLEWLRTSQLTIPGVEASTAGGTEVVHVYDGPLFTQEDFFEIKKPLDY